VNPPTEAVPALSIGAVVGGQSPSAAKWRASIRALTNAVAIAAQEIQTPININVIYQVPGHIIKPDFEGVRTGVYSKSKRWLIVQVALPEKAPDDSDAYVRRTLAAAVDEAERWARKRGITDNLDSLRRLVARLSGGPR
jgi:hypothetical protein